MSRNRAPQIFVTGRRKKRLQRGLADFFWERWINSHDSGHHQSFFPFFQMSLTPDDVEGFSSVSLDNWDELPPLDFSNISLVIFSKSADLSSLLSLFPAITVIMACSIAVVPKLDFICLRSAACASVSSSTVKVLPPTDTIPNSEPEVSSGFGGSLPSTWKKTKLE